MNKPPLLDVCQVKRNFVRAAADYDNVAVFQREIARRMLERLDFIKFEPGRILDLGCGTGFDLSALSERYKTSQVTGLDQSEAMLHAGKGSQSSVRWLFPRFKLNRVVRLCASAEKLPLKNSSADFIWSNLMLHWLNDAQQALREMFRVLDEEGLLMFSVLGPDSFKELRESFSDGQTHTLPFYDLHDYGDLLQECGFSDPVMDVDRVVMNYRSLDDLLAELRRNGGSCATHDRNRGLMGKKNWQAMRAAYEKKVPNGIFPVTLEVIYGHAWKPVARKTADGSDIVRFESKSWK